MAVIKKSIYIERAPDKVFNYLIDVEKHVEWSGELSFGLESIEKITPGTLKPGSTFKSRGQLSSRAGVEDTSTVTEMELNHRLAWDTVSEGPGRTNNFRWVYTLEPQGRGTRLTYSLEARHFNPKPFQLWFPPLLWIVDHKVFGREMEGGLNKLKEALEKQEQL